MSQKVNLNAYFERIGFAGSIAPTLATLETILGLHPAAIPFENLSPLLGVPVELDLKAIEKKLLAEKRGGYCFEHNLLLAAVLRELDFPVKLLAARVLPETERKTHMLLLVEIGGAQYLADAGFGGNTPTAPLRLRADSEQQTPHGTYRLTGGDPLWQLEIQIDETWTPLHAFETTEKTAADYDAANAYVSSDPTSPFTTELRVALSPAGKRIKLLNNRLNILTIGEGTETRDINSVAELREVLTTAFGIQLPASDLLDPKLAEILARAGVAES
ncbi:MAG: arylamine N-acetyltransferase [Candidatus Devosia phytovorans]|uniref:Arylamine N-acetyltransferase n=1 Tax=Candidatus Devosia phytovorans TaxID=3121372 RepID=A0AAJ6AZL6_9HYPH|nr:arylamine N-acetyltransferase [Devosia sp.]WEK03966.1 MAG: arylamine N-acetyltransferase [Devosia sp.]